MKNIILVDLDSDREQQVKISKPQSTIDEVENSGNAKEMIIADITTLCNGLSSLIQLGEDKEYFNGEELAKMCIKYLSDNFITDNFE